MAVGDCGTEERGEEKIVVLRKKKIVQDFHRLLKRNRL